MVLGFSKFLCLGVSESRRAGRETDGLEGRQMGWKGDRWAGRETDARKEQLEGP